MTRHGGEEAERDLRLGFHIVLACAAGIEAFTFIHCGSVVIARKPTTSFLSPPRRDEFEEGEDLEVLLVEGREAADAGKFEGRGEGRVENPLPTE